MRGAHQSDFFGVDPQGFGTTEAVYRKFMLGSHGSLSQLLCMAMAVRAIHLAWSMLGALVALTGAYKLKPADTLDGLT